MPEQLQELTDKQKEAGREKTEKETVLTEKKGADTGCNFTVSKYECKKRRIR